VNLAKLADDRPSNLPKVMSITRSVALAKNGDSRYVLWFTTTPEPQPLRALIQFIERHQTGVTLRLTETRGIMIVSCREEPTDAAILRWLQMNLEPHVPYTASMHVTSRWSPNIKFHVVGRSEPADMEAIATALRPLDGLTYVRTEGATLHFTMERALMEEPAELVQLVQSGQRTVTITAMNP